MPMKRLAVETRTVVRRRRAHAASFVAVSTLLMGNNHAAAQTGASVLVVVNDATRTGSVVATRYAERRAVPRENICHLRTTSEETVSRDDYVQQIEQRVRQCLTNISTQQHVSYI